MGQSEGTASTYVLEFPVRAPENAIVRNDLSALDQLEHWKLIKKHYCEHNPSVTISIGEDEWVDAAAWLYKNWDIIGGLAFLPRSSHVYQLAPYEEITKEQYEALAATLPEIDFSSIVMYEKEDKTIGAKELACQAGVCEFIPEGIPLTKETGETEGEAGPVEVPLTAGAEAALKA